MKKILLLVLFLLPVFVFSQMKQYTYDANAGTGLVITQYGHTLSGVVFTPVGYDTSTKKWPVILFFHGAGEASSTKVVSKILAQGLPKNIKAGLSIPYIVIAVQDQWSTPSPQTVEYVLRTKFLKEWKIDTTRIYATGLSFGGGGSLAMAIAYPKLISAVMSASPSALQPVEVTKLDTLAENKVPVWFWYGTKDTGPFGDNAKNYSTKIASVGGSTWITTEAVGHGPWDNIYTGKSLLNGKTIYQYFDSYSKVAIVPPVTPEQPKPVKKLILSVTATIKVYDDGSYELIK